MSNALVLVLLAFVAANLPFLIERRLFVLPAPAGKTFIWRAFELLLLYLVVGLLAVLVERNLGAIHAQRWEFYATTACLFMVFAYPGYVYRYMWRRK